MTAILYLRSVEAMNTRFDLMLRGEDEQHLDAVAVAVCEEIQRLDATLSRFNPGSEIARANREAIHQFVRIDRELFALLERCEQARVLTEGYFDITQSAALQLDEGTCAVRLMQSDAFIDLGAIGKGYALDRGREILLRYRVTSGLLQGGTSSVLAMGEEAWPIAVRHPFEADRIVTQLMLVNRGFSCSAVRHVGQLQSDVINPHTSQPLSGTDACFVLAASATEAEIFSTALLAMGKEKAVPYLAKLAIAPLDVQWIV